MFERVARRKPLLSKKNMGAQLWCPKLLQTTRLLERCHLEGWTKWRRLAKTQSTMSGKNQTRHTITSYQVSSTAVKGPLILQSRNQDFAMCQSGPYLNLIETLWWDLKRPVQKQMPTNLKEWSKIPPQPYWELIKLHRVLWKLSLTVTVNLALEHILENRLSE